MSLAGQRVDITGNPYHVSFRQLFKAAPFGDKSPHYTIPVLIRPTLKTAIRMRIIYLCSPVTLHLFTGGKLGPIVERDAFEYFDKKDDGSISFEEVSVGNEIEISSEML